MNQPSMKIITVILVTLPGLMCNSLTAYLNAIHGLRIVGQVANPADATAAVQTYFPDVLLWDANLDDPTRLDLLSNLHQNFPAMNIVVLSDTLRQQRAALQCGVQHALLKGWLDHQLQEALFPPPVDPLGGAGGI